MSEKRTEITGRVQGGFHEALTRAAPSAGNIVIGDTDHGSLAVREFLSSDQTMRALAESGVSHVCMEIPKEFDHLAKDYQNGTITAEEFTDRLSQGFRQINKTEMTDREYSQKIVAAIDNANRYGMEVHFVDPGIKTTQELNQLSMEAIRAYEAATKQRVLTEEQVPDAVRYSLDNKLLPPEKHERLMNELIEVGRGRVTDDELHTNIQQATNGEKSAIVYGNLHDDLVRRLGSDTLVVDIYRDGRAFHERPNLREDRPGSGYGEPGLVHIVEDKQTFVTDRATPQQSVDLTIEQDKQPPNGYFLGFIPIDPPSRTPVNPNMFNGP